MAFKRVATEGATTDGREISRDWLQQMADNYDPNVYGARISLEHIKGILPDSPFKAYGDIKALKVEENADGKLQLYADIDPTDELKAMTKNRQKVYSSMEVDPSFADTGEAYLVGLAVTDTPASLGTEMLHFSAQQGDKSPLAARKRSKNSLFSVAVETELDFSDADTSESETDQEGRGGKDASPSILDSVKALFKKHDKSKSAEFAGFRKDLEATLELFVKKQQATEEDLEGRPTAAAFAELKQAHEDLQAKFDQLYKKLDETPDTEHRATATGSTAGGLETDC